MLTTSQYKMRAIALLASFVVVLILMFMPIFPDLKPGQKTDGLTFMDNFFNSLSKYSSNFIDDKGGKPGERSKAAKVAGVAVDATLTIKDHKAKDKTTVLIPAADLAAHAVKVLSANGIEAAADGATLTVKGDYGKLLTGAVADAELMYKNDGKAIADKYGMDERAAIYAWHNTVNGLVGFFKKANQLELSNQALGVVNKALEPAYNYYQVDAKNPWNLKYLIPLILALAFYVLYTCWYGFGIMYMFEAMGVKLEH